MAIKTKSSVSPAAPVTSYVDFVPACDLHKEEGLETLIIHLPDFKKNQIKVQVNKDGVLKVSGELPTNAEGTKKSRFLKETKIPKGCDVNDIRAKLTDGRLHVMMPKRVTPPSPQVVEQHPVSTSLATPQPDVTDYQTPKLEAATIFDEQKTKGTTSTEMAGTISSNHQMFEHGSIIQRLHLQGRKVAFGVGVGVAVATMVAIGAFVAS